MSDQGVLGGKPCVRGTRLSVEHVVLLLAQLTREEILHQYPRLAHEDLDACVDYVIGVPP